MSETRRDTGADPTASGTPAQGGRRRPGDDHRAGKLTSKGERRRQQILDAAAVLFDQAGYHQASLGDIATAANMAKANIYHYFRAKHDILYAIHDEWIDLLVDSFRNSAHRETEPARLLHSVIHDLLFLMHTRRSHVRVYFEYLRELPPDLQERAKAKRDEYEGLVESTVRDGIEAGSFVQMSSRLATFALFGMCNWAYQWYRPGGSWSYEHIADELFRIFTEGVYAPQ